MVVARFGCKTRNLHNRSHHFHLRKDEKQALLVRAGKNAVSLLPTVRCHPGAIFSHRESLAFQALLINNDSSWPACYVISYSSNPVSFSTSFSAIFSVKYEIGEINMAWIVSGCIHPT